jgi:hypothetical protein
MATNKPVRDNAAPCGSAPNCAPRRWGEMTWTKGDKATGKFTDQKKARQEMQGRAAHKSYPDLRRPGNRRNVQLLVGAY